MTYKKELKSIKFDEFTKNNNYEEVAKHLDLKQPWILPQALAYVAEHWQPRLVGDQYSARETLKQISGTWEQGLFLAITSVARSLLVQKQATPEGAHYCALVPLILAAYKKYHNIPYSQWNVAELNYAMDKNLLAAITCDYHDLGSERLLEIRNQGLTIKTGDKQGQLRNPISTWRLYNLQDTEIGKLPTLAQTMICQCWCAHPQLRNEYMILDPNNWDKQPPALISDDIFFEKPRTKPKAKSRDKDCVDLPWNI